MERGRRQGEDSGVVGFLSALFPNRLNIVVALLLLPFWLAVVVGFFSIFFNARAHSHVGSRATSPR